MLLCGWAKTLRFLIWVFVSNMWKDKHNEEKKLLKCQGHFLFAKQYTCQIVNLKKVTACKLFMKCDHSPGVDKYITIHKDLKKINIGHF